MESDETKRILGTRVPDTPIHRASLWLEDLKYGDRRKDNPGVERFEGEFWEEFIRQCALPVTAEQLQEAATYYGENVFRMIVGDRIDFAIPSPTGEGVIDGRAIFVSLWLDAFMHGVAAAKGKVGLSSSELEF